MNWLVVVLVSAAVGFALLLNLWMIEEVQHARQHRPYRTGHPARVDVPPPVVGS